MGLLKFGKQKEIDRLKKELVNQQVKNRHQQARIEQLEKLCVEKDAYFKEMISDGMRHHSSLAAKHMSDRKKYLKGK